MKTTGSVKRKSHAFATLIGASITLALFGCDETNTDTDYKSIDVSQAVSDWEMVWSDEFDGDAIDSNKWFHEVNCSGGGNQEQQCYTDSAENSFVAEGILNIVAKPAGEDSPLPYTSARLNTKNLADFKYGRFEMRAKMPFGQGSWPAFWMLPTDDVYGTWPNSGEIDIIEAVNLKTINDEGVTEANVYGTLHYGGFSGKSYLLPEGMNPADDFHTYAIEWQEGEIRWYVDGYLFATQMASKVRTNSKDQPVGLSHRGWYSKYHNIITGELETHWDEAPFNQDFHMLLNLAVGGSWAGNVNDGGIDAAAFANGQTLAIDYVRVYECSVDPETGKGCGTVRAGYKDEETLVIGVAPVPSPPSTGVAVNLTIFEDAENQLWQLWDCCGGSNPEVITDDEEHGAVSEFIVGAEPTVLGYTTREGHGVVGSGPFDASPMINAGTVSFDMKVVTPPASAATAWHLKLESSEGTTEADILLSNSNEGAAPVSGVWQTYTFNLSDIEAAGLDLSAIDVLMIFPSWGEGEGTVYLVDNVKIAQQGGTSSLPELVLFEDSANQDWAVWDCCSGTMPTEEIDDEEHGTTVEFSITGSGETVMGFNSRSGDGGAGNTFDASALAADGLVQFDLKLVTAADAGDVDWKLKLETDGGESAIELDFTESDEGVAPTLGEWQTYSYKVSDLIAAGFDVSAIDVLMIFPAWGTGTGAVYRVDNFKIYSPNSAGDTGGGNSAATGMLFDDAAASGWVLWDCCGGSTPTVETDDAEHGATAEFSIGPAPTVMGITSRSVDGGGGTSFDASALLASGVVQFEMKVVTPTSDPSTPWSFKIESGGGDKAVEILLTDSLEGAPPITGEWQTYTFSIQDIFDADVYIDDLDVLMIFPAWGAGEGAVYRVDNLKIANP